jgi:hypothetical protein
LSLLRSAADKLAILAPAQLPEIDLSPGGEEMFARMEHSYTMASERLVYEQFFGRLPAAAPSAPAPAEAALDDILF